MIIGLTGVGSIGKSWAASQLAAQLGYEYVPSKASQVAKDIGFDVNSEHSFKERLGYQAAIRNRMIEDLSGSAYKNMVFDRTPIDLMAYTIVANGPEALSPEVDTYLTHCRSVLNVMFDMIVLISPPYDQLIGMGEYKEGRVVNDHHYGEFHRVVLDNTIKTLLTPKEVCKKLLVVPEELHYQDRVDFIKERIDDYRTAKDWREYR